MLEQQHYREALRYLRDTAEPFLISHHRRIQYFNLCACRRRLNGVGIISCIVWWIRPEIHGSGVLVHGVFLPVVVLANMIRIEFN